MEDNYSKAYKEVIEILKYVPEDSVNKIPKEMTDMFEEQQDKAYNFQIDTEKTFEEQELLEETKAILANIFRDYWATPYQKERIIAKENYDRQKIEQEKSEKYNPSDIFKKKNIELIQETTTELPIEYKEKFFEKIINFFKRLFKI